MTRRPQLTEAQIAALFDPPTDQRELEPEVEPNRLLNDLGREPVTCVGDFLHPLGYRTASGTASATLRDNAGAKRQLGLRQIQTRARRHRLALPANAFSHSLDPLLPLEVGPTNGRRTPESGRRRYGQDAQKRTSAAGAPS